MVNRAFAVAILTLGAFPAGGCFDPTYPIGVTCGAGGECPPGQQCNTTTQMCGFDPGQGDAGVDAGAGGPTVELSEPLATLSGCARLTYRLTSPLEGQRFDVDFEVDRGDGHLVRMSPAASPLGVGGTRHIATGDALTFVWDTTADLRDANASVRIVATPRVVVGPKAGKVGTPGVLEGIPVQNAPGYTIASGGGFLAGVTVQVGDVDHNGQRDTLIASGSRAVLWNGSSSKNVDFASAVHVALAADFDQDGYPDIAVLRDGGFVTIAFNDPSFPSDAFTQKLDLAAGTELHDLIAVDVDADGLVDLVASDAVGRVAVLRQQRMPAGSFAAVVTIPAGTAPAGLAGADVDGDRRVDLVVGQSGGHDVVVLHGSATIPGSFDAAGAIAGLAGDHVATADFDRDGRIDVAALDASTGVLALARQAPAPGSFAIDASVATGVGPGLLAASVDHDERPDLLTGQAGQLMILHGVAGGFRAESLASAPHLLDFAVGDLDRDGQKDIVVAGGETIVFHMAREPGPICDSNLAAVLGTSAPGVPLALEAADLNDDGKLDAVVSTADSVYILYGLGDGQLTSQGPSELVAGSAGAPATLDPGAPPSAAAIGDIDHDGDLDLVVAPASATYMVVWLHDRTSPYGYAFIQIPAVPAHIASVAIGDVDHDGLDDVLVRADGRLLMVRQLAGAIPSFDGSFESLDPTTHLGSGLALADLDGDGSSEIIIAEDQHLLVYQASDTMPISYGAPTSIDAHLPLGKLALGDLDGDGDLDVLALATGSGLVMARGDGKGGLAFDAQLATGEDAAFATDFSRSGDDVFVVETPPVAVRPATTERWHLGPGGVLAHVTADDLPFAGVIASGDFDSDGVTDVALGEPASTVLVARRGGAGPIATLVPRDVATSDRPSLTIGRFDGDALDDLLVAVGDGAARLVHQAAGGGFAAPVELPGSSAMLRVAHGDLDGDRLDDLAYLSSDGDAFVRLQDHGAPGSFAAAVPVGPAELEVHDLAVADLNSDGFDDLVLVGRATSGGSVVWLAGRADGVPGAPVELRPATVGFERVLAVDINGGGAIGDLVLLRNDGGTIETLRQEGAPAVFSPPDVYAFDTLSPIIREIGFADLNGDRHGDLLLVRANAPLAQRRGSTSSPGLLLAPIEMDPDLGRDVQGVALADVNRDGFVDLAMSLADPARHTRISRQDPMHPGAFLAPVELPGDGHLVTLVPLTPDALPEWITDDAGGVMRLPLSAPRHPWP